MKAVLSDEPFSDPGWIFERKLDGVRWIAYRERSGVRLLSRTDRDMNAQFPELVAALEAQPSRDFVLDGEIVAFDRRGVTSFSRLQRRGRERCRSTSTYSTCCATRARICAICPCASARPACAARFASRAGCASPTHRNEHGEEMFAEACRKGLEGIIAKRADSPYRASRSRDWLKLKCHAEQELVIGGFTAPQGSRTHFGALLVGHHEHGRLEYAGKVGTGFDAATLSELGGRLRRLERDSSPFAEVHPVPRGTHWVEPELVAQIGFTEWTRDGRLRHPRYLGLRDDKPASDVVRERPS